VAPDDPEAASTDDVVDKALSAWRQGDCVLGSQWFAFRVDPSRPLTDAARDAAEAAVDLVEVEVSGFAVLTQTCDIVRASADRPFIEVCPLVEVSTDVLLEIKKARRPSYAFIPALENRRLVADLDRVMTVEKSVVVQWARVPGWTSDVELRAFSQALGRKRVRFAFPDDFVALVKPLQDRLIEKHGKNSIEGRALRELREIRVAASPSWDHDEVSVMFYFVRTEETSSFEGRKWHKFLDGWLKLISPGGRFKEIEGQVSTLEHSTAAEYVASDPLDLDHLSSTSQEG
jgi:hypothetical protein